MCLCMQLEERVFSFSDLASFNWDMFPLTYVLFQTALIWEPVENISFYTGLRHPVDAFINFLLFYMFYMLPSVHW